MMTLLETMANVNSYLFLLSLLGPMFFKSYIKYWSATVLISLGIRALY